MLGIGRCVAGWAGGVVSPETRPMLHYCVGDIDGYAIMVHDDPDGRVRWAASLRALPGCIAQGDSRQEALTKLRAIWPRYRDHLERHGCTISDPDPPNLTIGDAWVSA
jgi:predicted RNase H-like HicB family nuclease